MKIEAGDVLTIQAAYGAYQDLREETGEAEPPCVPVAA
jgi:hypothetical protein